MKNRISDKIKTKIAVESIKENSTLAQIASKYGVHPQTVAIIKKKFLQNAHLAFSHSDSVDKAISGHKDEINNLRSKIGKLYVENEWIKKKLDPYL